MSKTIIVPLSNISDGVEFILKGANKRRAMAVASVRQINTSLGVNLKLISNK